MFIIYSNLNKKYKSKLYVIILFILNKNIYYFNHVNKNNLIILIKINFIIIILISSFLTLK